MCGRGYIDDLEKKNFFKIERLEAEIVVLKDQYKLLTEQQRLNIQKKPESRSDARSSGRWQSLLQVSIPH